MDFKFSKDSGDSQHEGAPGEKKKQSALLVLLLILVGGFTYLYFFTPLIKPQEVQKSAETPASAPQVVKMPLPVREGEPSKTDEKAPAITVAPKAAETAPVTAAAPAAKPAAASAKPAPAAVVKPAPLPAKPNEETKKVEAAKPAGKKPQPVPVTEKKVEQTAPTKAETEKSADLAKKPVVAAKKNATAKTKKAVPDSWSLMVGNYVLEEALSADMGRVRKAGFEPIVKPAARKKTAMSRLFVSEFNDRATAQSTLEKLQRHTSDAFVIEHGGRFAVYAGSYLQSEAASSEQKRLKAAGFTATIKRADIAIPAQSLSVGPFKGKKAADAARGKLKSAGIKATLLQK